MQVPFANLAYPLPDVSYDTEGLIETGSVLGPYGITAEVSSFAEVLDWQEKRKGLTQGYYRLIHPPRIQQLLARLRMKFPGWHPVLFTSPQLALKEWCECGVVHGWAAPYVAGTPAWLNPKVSRALGLERATALHGASIVLHEDLPEELPPSAEVVIGHLVAAAQGFGLAMVRDADTAALFYERNRRRGGVVSGRVIAAMTGEDSQTSEKIDPQQVRDELCRLEQAEEAFLYPSGMQAVTVALDQIRSPGRETVLVMGHVYRDTHILLEEMDWAGPNLRGIFLSVRDLEGLRRYLRERDDVAAVFLETVTNPLIQAADLPRVAELAKTAGVPLLVDSTMATPANCQPLVLGADVVIHSTSKYLSGSNQHGGGAILTRDRVWAEKFQADQARWANHMSELELPGLWQGLQNFPERMERFTENGRRVRSLLRAHPAVAEVFPKEEEKPEFLRDWGSVISFCLAHNRLDGVRSFFDAPLTGFHKAPSLGSNHSLFCPYVLLTYYDKSDAYLQDVGLPRYLLRLAIGCEEQIEPLLQSLRQALDATCAGA